MSGFLPDGTELVASTDLRGNKPANVEIAIDYDSMDVAGRSIRYSVAPEDEDIEYEKMISAFVEAAKIGTGNCSYLSEVLITHRDLITARALAK